MTGMRKVFCLWGYKYLLYISLDLTPKHLAAASLWDWLEFWWMRQVWGVRLIKPLDSVWSCGCLQRYKLLFLTWFWLQLQWNLCPHSSSNSSVAVCSLVTGELFFRLNFLRTTRVCGGLDEKHWSQSWSRGQILALQLLQCMNQELNLSR